MHSSGIASSASAGQASATGGGANYKPSQTKGDKKKAAEHAQAAFSSDSKYVAEFQR
jgi:hypothetical protein